MRDEQAPGPSTQASVPKAPGRLGRRRDEELPELDTSDAGAVLDLVTLRVGRDSGTVGRVRVLGPGERAVAHLAHVALRGARDLLGQVGVPLHELRRLAG